MNEKLISAYAAFTSAEEFGAVSADSPGNVMLPTTTVLWWHQSVVVTFGTCC